MEKIVKILPGDIINELFAIDNDLKMGYQLKELFLDIVYHAEIDNVERQLNDFIDICNESGIEEFIDAASTIKNWLPYILNSFIDKRLSNDYTEGLNNKIKVIKRVGFEYKNLD